MNIETLKQLANHAGGNFLPVLANVHVYQTPQGNRAQVGNGRYWVDVPTDLPPMTVNSGKLSAAVAACTAMPSFNVTASQVSLTAGRIRARLRLDPTEYPVALPEPRSALAVPGVGDVLRALAPFAATDASRPWATSVCLCESYAYSTNNVVVARQELSGPVHATVNIPVAAIEAVVERGDVIDIGYTESAVTFYYEDGSWVKTQLVTGSWPTAVVDQYIESLSADWLTVNESLPGMFATAAKLSDDRNPIVQFNGESMALVDESFEVNDVDPIPGTGKLSAKMAALVFSTAKEVQWHSPKQDAHGFRTGTLYGVLGGTR
jgi:hypothetical protein